MKKMLIVLAALTVMGAGFVTAEDKEPSTAYMHGYNHATKGLPNTCGSYASNRTQSESSKEKIEYDCNRGNNQREAEKAKQSKNKE